MALQNTYKTSRRIKKLSIFVEGRCRDKFDELRSISPKKDPQEAVQICRARNGSTFMRVSTLSSDTVMTARK